MTDSSVSAVIETVDVALRTYFLSPASEPQLTTPDEFHEAIRGLKVSKAPVPKGIPNRILKHLPRRAVSLLALIFNAVLRDEDKGMLGLLNRKSGPSVRNGALLYKQLVRPHDGLCVPRVEVRCPHPCREATDVAILVS